MFYIDFELDGQQKLMGIDFFELEPVRVVLHANKQLLFLSLME